MFGKATQIFEAEKAKMNVNFVSSAVLKQVISHQTRLNFPFLKVITRKILSTYKSNYSILYALRCLGYELKTPKYHLTYAYAENDQ